MLKRVIAVLVLLLVAVIAIRVVIGFVSAVLWIVVLAALIVAALWAWSTLRSAKRDRAVKKGSPGREVAAAPAEDPVAVEMRRITEELRERQGR